MSSLRILFLCLAVVFLLCISSEAREFVVGGENNLWEVPSSVDEFNKWAEKTRFQTGDSLVLKYDSKTDSVLEVSEEDYKICNKANPIKSHHDGETKVSLEKSGPFFLISGAEEQCQKGQKLEIATELRPEYPLSVSLKTQLTAEDHFLKTETTYLGILGVKVPKYDSKTDSVLEVSEEDYKICNKANPIKSHHDGETKVSLEKSGPFFLISGAEEQCQKGQKLEIATELRPEYPLSVSLKTVSLQISNADSYVD